ncbi:MAG: L-2-amino-thiazoline-4-carboxylic acid hydrolase [Desulfovibrio sp.]|nr:L-2-amino-thiazoline-4-carboxylic acid hydrolase [Desulfovibrio sp.]MBI4960455.1 L-2-amino-thiazoline-4-carboxylic acid hydrolase [Desulfovibrio sp.]
MVTISRRKIIQAGCVAACGCVFPWNTRAASQPNYYAVSRERLLGEFKGVCEGVRQYLNAKHPASQAAAISADAISAFDSMLLSMADLGGDSNRNQQYLTQAGWLAAIYAAMKAKGMAAKDAGRLFYDLNAEELASTPAAQLAARGAAFFSPESKASLAEWARWTHERLYPGDWVATAFFSDGSDFDMGYDMLECGVAKFFKAQKMEDVAPYFCLNDFPRSRCEGTGLYRSMTIAQGDVKCDFRYKQGREVVQGWETEVARFPDKPGA